jgi:hypothetical protein
LFLPLTGRSLVPLLLLLALAGSFLLRLLALRCQLGRALRMGRHRCDQATHSHAKDRRSDLCAYFAQKAHPSKATHLKLLLSHAVLPWRFGHSLRCTVSVYAEDTFHRGKATSQMGVSSACAPFFAALAKHNGPTIPVFPELSA